MYRQAALAAAGSHLSSSATNSAGAAQAAPADRAWQDQGAGASDMPSASPTAPSRPTRSPSRPGPLSEEVQSASMPDSGKRIVSMGAPPFASTASLENVTSVEDLSSRTCTA